MRRLLLPMPRLTVRLIRTKAGGHEKRPELIRKRSGSAVLLRDDFAGIRVNGAAQTPRIAGVIEQMPPQRVRNWQ